MVYQLLIRLLSPLIVVITVIDALKRKGGIRFFKQRFGFDYPNLAKHPIWIHCASVGEVKAVEVLVQNLYKNFDIIISTSTPTGAFLVESLFSTQVKHAFLPLDYPIAINRFLKAIKPRALWVVETEIWPNLYRITARKGVRITLINARLSKKTLTSPAWLKQEYKTALSHVAQLLAKSEDDASRFRQLGALDHSIQVLGNLKYAGLTTLPDYPNSCPREFVLLASSHDDEEKQITQIWQKLKRPELLVIVPRHPQRSKQIQQQLEFMQPHLAVFSKNEPIQADTQVYLNDQIGVLMPLFAHAKLVIMGGAFVPKGGHNVMEPAALKRAIITGPDMSDFIYETEQLHQQSAIIQLQNYEELTKVLSQLLQNKSERSRMGNAAYQVIKKQECVLEAYEKALLAKLPPVKR